LTAKVKKDFVEFPIMPLFGPLEPAASDVLVRAGVAIFDLLSRLVNLQLVHAVTTHSIMGENSKLQCTGLGPLA
jgi:hypothetical protein